VQAENKAGTRTILDILDAQRDLLNAQVQYVSAQRNAYVAGFSLIAAMGHAEARDLGLDQRSRSMIAVGLLPHRAQQAVRLRFRQPGEAGFYFHRRHQGAGCDDHSWRFRREIVKSPFWKSGSGPLPCPATRYCAICYRVAGRGRGPVQNRL
jgi:hypothetical protein